MIFTKLQKKKKTQTAAYIWNKIQEVSQIPILTKLQKKKNSNCSLRKEQNPRSLSDYIPYEVAEKKNSICSSHKEQNPRSLSDSDPHYAAEKKERKKLKLQLM